MNNDFWNELAEARRKLKIALNSVDELLKKRPIEPASEMLDDETVREIRKCYGDNGESQVALAKRYGVHKSTISRLVRFQIHKTA